MQRSRRCSSGSLVESVADDDEMEAMAKVWAHPEDLHLFPVSLIVLNTHKQAARFKLAVSLADTTNAVQPGR